MKKAVSTLLLLLSFALFVAGVYFVKQGFDKKDNYSQAEYSWEENINVYVGGDAYNYIINGTYFAGYCALGGAMFICGSIAGVGGLIGAAMRNKDKENVLLVSGTDHTANMGIAPDVEST